MAGGKYTQKQKILLVVAIVISVFSIVNLIVGLSGGGGDAGEFNPVDQVYYFDMDGKKLVAGDPDAPPERAARAFVFACGDCSKSKIGYLIAERSVKGPEGQPGRVVSFVTTPDQLSQWVPEESPEGHTLIRAKRQQKCPEGASLKQCFP